MIKKIDRLVLNSFAGPFTAAFGIALFVLIMQFLWLYIDDIAGKGVNFLLMLELIGYLSISIIPMALPVAVMLASVMVMGNLAERYELSSMKSAGISLLRILVPLMLVCSVISLFSYVCSDFLIPASTLKFKTRLYDIKRQKPALSIEKGVLNEDFRQFVIRIGDKKSDGETIEEVMIIDQSSPNVYLMNEILADSGQMYTTQDRRFFIMNLFDGVQYQEPRTNPAQPGKGRSYPFVRIAFGSMTKVWDMREFEINRTDEDNFKSNRQMLTMSQLRETADSLNRLIGEQHRTVARDVLVQLEKKVLSVPPEHRPDSIALAHLRNQPDRRAKEPVVPAYSGAFAQDTLSRPLTAYSSLLETFPASSRASMLEEAQKRVKSHLSVLETRQKQIQGRRLDEVKTLYDLYIKYSFAIICLLFLFIGGPMGAIIRKGGFGYPILVSIIFFVMFVMLTIMCRKLAESFFMPPFWAAMMPWLVLMPIAGVLTWKALNDSRMLNFDRLTRLQQFFIRRTGQTSSSSSS